MIATAISTAVAPSMAVACDASTDRAEWDAYVRAHREATFFHLSGWCEAARAAYGYEPVYVSVRRNGALVGVLPLVDVRAPLLGRSLVSTAFTVGGGPLADDAEARAALLDAAMRAGIARTARYVECRSDFSADESWRAKPNTAAMFRIALADDADAALGAIPKRRRADIRKAINAAEAGRLAVRYDGAAEVFYSLYASALRSLGTPVFPKRFLSALLHEFDQEAEISVVSHEARPVAALLTFWFKNSVLPYYVGATPQARTLHAFDFLYWDLMRRAVERRCATFDFGRSRVGSGAYTYKKLWGAEPEPVTYRIKLIRARGMPDINPNNPKFKLFAGLWPRLPLGIANRLGPVLARNFP